MRCTRTGSALNGERTCACNTTATAGIIMCVGNAMNSSTFGTVHCCSMHIGAETADSVNVVMRMNTDKLCHCHNLTAQNTHTEVYQTDILDVLGCTV